MAEMTIAPVATHGFFIDGKWLEEGDIVEIRAPYDGAVVGRVYRGRREHAEAAIAAAVKRASRSRPPALKSSARFLPSISLPRRRFAVTANICPWIGSSPPPAGGELSGVFHWGLSQGSHHLIFR